MQDLDRQRWNDRDLVSATLSGDKYAGDVLFARYESYSRRIAVRYTSSPDAAAEAAAAGKALAFEKLDTLRDPDRFGAWMATIVRNSAATAQRQRSREVPHAEVPELQPADTAPEQSAPNETRLLRARAALLSLSPRDRQALELSVYERLPVNEVAAALMIDVNTAYQVLSRARKRARRAYLTPRVPDDAPLACHKCSAKTPDYLRGLQSVRAKVEAHVEFCSGCRARLADMLAESTRIKGLFSLVPLGLAGSWSAFVRRLAPHSGGHVVVAGAVVSGLAVMAGVASAYVAIAPGVHHGATRGGATRVPADASYHLVAPPLVAPESTAPTTTTSVPVSLGTAATVTTTTTTTPPHTVAPRSALAPTTKAPISAITPLTTTTTSIPHKAGTLLSGNGTTKDENGSADATWEGTSAYDSGPTSGTQSFDFTGTNGLTDGHLEQLGSSDITVSFDLNTIQKMSPSGAVDLLGYRSSCQGGDFFDVRLGASAASGDIEVEFDTATTPTVLYSTVPVNDGTWHQIVITRRGNSLSLRVDGGTASTTTLATGADVTNSAVWQMADGDPCVGQDGTTSLIGSMANIYVGP